MNSTIFGGHPIEISFDIATALTIFISLVVYIRQKQVELSDEKKLRINDKIFNHINLMIPYMVTYQIRITESYASNIVDTVLNRPGEFIELSRSISAIAEYAEFVDNSFATFFEHFSGLKVNAFDRYNKSINDHRAKILALSKDIFDTTTMYYSLKNNYSTQKGNTDKLSEENLNNFEKLRKGKNSVESSIIEMLQKYSKEIGGFYAEMIKETVLPSSANQS